MSCRHGNHYDGCDICDEVDASFEAGRRSALAEQPAPVVNVQHKRTTYTERFTHAVAVLCGAQPPAELVAEWFEDVAVNGGHRLQSWVGAQHATPSWAQCIVVLDAAHVLASDPEEGEGHEDVDGGTPQAQPAREWVGLTEEEKTELRRKHYPLPLLLMNATEAKLKEKNT